VESNPDQVIREARAGGGAMVITGMGADVAEIQDCESFERTRQAMAMLMLVAMTEDGKRTGRIYPHPMLIPAVRSQLRARRKAGG
jgi:hypothetical protein